MFKKILLQLAIDLETILVSILIPLIGWISKNHYDKYKKLKEDLDKLKKELFDLEKEKTDLESTHSTSLNIVHTNLKDKDAIIDSLNNQISVLNQMNDLFYKHMKKELTEDMLKIINEDLKKT